MTEYKAVLEQDTGATILVRVSPNNYSEYSVDGNKWYPFIDPKNNKYDENAINYIQLSATDYEELLCNISVNKNTNKVILDLVNTNNIPHIAINIDTLSNAFDLWILRKDSNKSALVLWGSNCIIDSRSDNIGIYTRIPIGVTLLSASKKGSDIILSFKGNW